MGRAPVDGTAEDHRARWVIAMLVVGGLRFIGPTLLDTTGCVTHPSNAGTRVDLALLVLLLIAAVGGSARESIRRWPNTEAAWAFAIIGGVLGAMALASPLVNGC